MEKDLLGFEIFNYSPSNTNEENIKALEAHISMLDGLFNEAISALENKVAELKY